MADKPSSGRISRHGHAGGTLVGRERELAELTSGLEQAIAGHGTVVLLAGEPGIGKTSLARTLSDEAEARGAHTAWGVGWSGGAAPAYWPWVQVVRALVRENPQQEDLLAELGAKATHLAEIVPELTDRPEAAREKASTDEGRFLAYDALVELLRLATRDTPLVVVFDDLHWADEASLQTLGFVARSLQDLPILLLATYRDAEMNFEGQGTALPADLLGWSRRIALTGLETEGIRSLIEQMSEGGASDQLVEHLRELTGGNPLFVGELVTLLDAEDRLGDGERATTAALPLPEGVRETISQRLAPLPEQAQEVLGVASVIGDRFSVTTLSTATDKPREELLGLIEAAGQIGLVHPVPESAEQFAFSHALVQATLYDGLKPSRRIALHRDVGETFEKLAGDRVDARLNELAHHFLEAAPLDGPERGVDYASRAGDRAMGQFAYDEAATMYQRALEALEGAGGNGSVALLQSLGEAQTRAGDTEQARRTLVQAAEVARLLDDSHGLARATLACGIWGLSFGVDDELVKLAEQSIERLGQDPAGGMLARVKGLLAVALYWSPESERVRRLSDRGRRAGPRGARDLRGSRLRRDARVRPRPRAARRLGPRLDHRATGRQRRAARAEPAPGRQRDGDGRPQLAHLGAARGR